MNFTLNRSNNLLRLLFYASISTTLLVQGFSVFKYANFILFDEWLGRGLYPGIAFFHGFDFYEPKSGPHVTLYGWMTGLFYSVVAICDNPNSAAWTAFSINVTSFFCVSFLIFRKLLSNKSLTYSAISALCLSSFSFSAHLLDPTTEGITRIHADLPAMLFLLLGIFFFLKLKEENKESTRYLLLCSFSLVLSTWAKLPTLFAIGFPFILLILDKEFSRALKYILYTSLIIGVTLFLSGLAYGFEDMKFILWDHTAQHSWNDRNNLFNGEKAPNFKLSFLETIPLLLRFCIMYLAEYYHFVLSALTCILVSFSTALQPLQRYLLRSTGLCFILLIPTCIAALAHFGGVENSLLFCNSMGIFCMLFLVLIIVQNFVSNSLSGVFFALVALAMSIPVARTTKSFDHNPIDSPHMQAYEYLSKGNSDVYFGWYPIAHAMVDKVNVTCTEVPIWVSMNLPDEIHFDSSHFPDGSKYLATCKVGYGGATLQYYLGHLEEVSSPTELSNWRLFKISENSD